MFFALIGLSNSVPRSLLQSWVHLGPIGRPKQPAPTSPLPPAACPGQRACTRQRWFENWSARVELELSSTILRNRRAALRGCAGMRASQQGAVLQACMLVEYCAVLNSLAEAACYFCSRTQVPQVRAFPSRSSAAGGLSVAPARSECRACCCASSEPRSGLRRLHRGPGP